MATYDVSTLSRGTIDGSTGAENFFISGAPTWILFAFTSTIDNIFNGVSLIDVAVSELTEGFSAAGIIIEDNGDLPVNATVTGVQLVIPGPVGVITKSGQPGDIVRAITAVAVSSEKNAGATEYRVHENTDLPEGLIEETLPVLDLLTNTREEPWTRDNIFEDMFGVYSQVTSGLGENHVALGWMLVRVTWTAVPPIVATGIPRVTGLVALLRASVDPMGATSAFPVTVRFRYGTLLDESDWIDGPTCDPETGFERRIVGAVIPNDLVSGQTYYFRAYADYADGTVTANNVGSFTPIQDDRIMAVL